MQEIKTHFKTLTNPNYIGSYALMVDEETTKELVVTITGAVKGLVQKGNEKVEALILQLKDQLPMILNATNRKMLHKITGSPFIENWTGKRITLYTTKVKVGGEFVDALRVRDTLAAAPAKVVQELTPEHAKWAGAIVALSAGNITIEKIKKLFALTPENEAILSSHVPVIKEGEVDATV